MGLSKKSKMQKRLEQLRKTQEINAIVERGSVEEQALLDSAGETRPVDEEQVLNLLNKSEEESQYLGSTTTGGRIGGRKASRKLPRRKLARKGRRK